MLELSESEQAPAMIQASLVGEAISLEEAKALPVGVVMALVEAITALNGLRGEPE